MVLLQREPIRPVDLLEAVRGDADGAVALFTGTVRNESEGRAVVALEYVAYGEMALRQMSELRVRALEEHAVSEVAIVHRLGRLAVGEISVAVAVSAAHRGAAFDACRAVMDTLKRTVPIWKKEIFADGAAVWVEPPG